MTSFEDMRELKSVIRGLVISSAWPMTIRQLEKDYKTVVGCEIPYSRYQYPSIVAFLRSIRDTVQLKEPTRGCPYYMIVVEPVQAENTRHLEEMVARQRKAAIESPKRTADYDHRANIHSCRNGWGPKFIHSNLKISVAQVLKRYSPKGLPLNLFHQELSYDMSMAGWEEGGPFGWLSVNGFESMKEVVDAFIDHGIIKTLKIKGQDWVFASNISEPSDQRAVDDASYRTQESSNSSRYDLRKAAEFSQASSECGVVPAGAEKFPDDGEVDNYAEDSDILVSRQMKKNFRALLAMHPNGLWCASLPHQYQKLTGCDLDVRNMGFVSVVDMASTLKDVFIPIRPESNSDWLLFDSKSNDVWNSAFASKGNRYPTLPSKFLKKIEALLADYPTGLQKFRFLTAYQEKYKEHIPMMDMGFSNAIDLLNHLAKRGLVLLKYNGNVSMVCQPFMKNENVSEEMKKDDDYINDLYPLDVVGRNDNIPVQEFPEGLAPLHSINLEVTDIVSPSKFWFQLYETHEYHEFHCMMDEMQLFYNSGGPSAYRMPDATIIIGQHCAVRYPPDQENGDWHRARITALPSLSEVEVFYSDYGTTGKCDRSYLRFLIKKYAKLPLQAHLGCLTNIRPLGYGLWKKSRDSSSGQLSKIKPTWTSAATDCFCTMALNGPLIAVVSRIRKTDNQLHAGLTDTSKEDDQHLNDILVDAKLAEFGEMSDEEDSDGDQ